MTDKSLKKETIRFYEDDVELIRKFYPGGYGKPGINEVIRSVINSWVDQTLRKKQISEELPDVDTSIISQSSVNGGATGS